MTPELRARVAQAWAETALDEHASVASFARHILELLALGAPADLVQGAQQAMAEEIDHAQRCFRLASRFAEEPLGPGPLDATGAMRSDPTQILTALAREGCINETGSVEAARFALEHTTDEQCRDTLEVIVHDETQHARLAWRTLVWGLKRFPESREAVEAVFAELEASARPLAAEPDAELLAFGQLDAESEQRVARLAVWEVVLPAWRVMIAE